VSFIASNRERRRFQAARIHERKEVSKTVFILGAGASATAGAPLMANFLDESERLRDGGEVLDAIDEFNLVFKGISALNRAHTKATLDVLNIESVFAAFEMAKLIGRLDPLSIEEIDLLPNAMRRVIVRTLERTVKIPIEKTYPRAPGHYGGFTELVKRLTAKQIELGKYISVITFNYDLCLDLAFYCAGISIKYCLDSSPVEPRDIALLKLHGSLNWGRCKGCGKLVAWKLGNFLLNRHWAQDDGFGSLEISKRMNEFEHCKSSQITDAPYVVPPTWNKSQYHGELESVWKAAARELSTAENIIVCGYSLPESDQFFRYLYALGTVGELRLKRLWVFDPNEAVGKRFKQLLGQAAIQRFQHSQYPFDGNVFGAVSSLV
jgi:NAD-dependent SIR2 family protein deacetylase